LLSISRYDLEADPGESVDLSSSRPDLLSGRLDGLASELDRGALPPK
jgi:hypothetical protein